jgi:acetyl-CoA C-acetyltransferase
MTTEAYIYDAIRTPRGKGKAGGSLYEVKPIDLITNLLESMKERNELDTSKVEDLIVATGEPVNEQGMNIAKTALVYSSWDDITTGAQLHRYCAGGLDAMNTAAMKVRSGFEDLVAAGGVESMSRLGMGASGAAAGDPWVAMKSYGISQGVGADLLATLNGITREDVDRYAVMSHQRAAEAQKNGYFDKSLIPVTDFHSHAGQLFGRCGRRVLGARRQRASRKGHRPQTSCAHRVLCTHRNRTHHHAGRARARNTEGPEKGRYDRGRH